VYALARTLPSHREDQLPFRVECHCAKQGRGEKKRGKGKKKKEGRTIKKGPGKPPGGNFSWHASFLLSAYLQSMREAEEEGKEREGGGRRGEEWGVDSHKIRHSRLSFCSSVGGEGKGGGGEKREGRIKKKG